MATTRQLDDLTVAELRKVAREQGLKRYSKMRKAELIRALASADGPRQEAAPSEGPRSPSTAMAQPNGSSPPPQADTEWRGAQSSPSNPSPVAGLSTEDLDDIEDMDGRESEQRATLDHDEIRAWAGERSAVPVIERGSWDGTEPRVLRFRFPQSGGDSLDQVDWPTWLRAFETHRLRLVYLVPADGSRSNGFRLLRR